MKSVEHAGRRTAYRVADRGDGSKTLVFVHGSGADRRVWKAQDRLASSHRVVALDLTGHGSSSDIEVAAGPSCLEVYAADLAAVAEAEAADVVIGNSLGGAVVQWALLETELDPTAAVLVGSGAKLAVHEDIRQMMTADFDSAIDFLHRPDLLFTDGVDERLEAASRDAMRACGRQITERDYLTCHSFDVRDRLDEIDIPVLAIGGSRDRLTPPMYHQYLARNLEHGVLSLVEDAAHLVMLEQPTSFNTNLEAFLDHVAQLSKRSGST